MEAGSRVMSRNLPEGDTDGAIVPVPAPDLHEEILTCRIEHWRGYVTSRFYALADDGSVVESGPFPWRRATPPPESTRARAAYDELVTRLETEGWTRLENGHLWYATTLARTIRMPRSGTETPTRGASSSPKPLPQPLALPREEPAQVEAAAPEPDEPIDRDPPPRRRRPLRSTMLALPVVGAAGAAALLLGGGHADGSPLAGNHPARAMAAQPVATSAPRASAVLRPVATARNVDVEIVAHGGGSWVEARRGSKTGPVIYSAVLAAGKHVHLRAPSLWARFGAAGNLIIMADGKPVVLRGTYDKLFRAPGR